VEGLNRAGSFGHNGRNSASQCLADDQAVRLRPGRQHKQVGRMPFLVQCFTDQCAGHRDPLFQPSRRDLGTYPSGIVGINSIGADQGGRPWEVRDLCQRLDQSELVLGRCQRGKREEVRWAARLATAACHRCWRDPRNRHAKITPTVPAGQLGGGPAARAQHPGGDAYRLGLKYGVPLPARGIEAELIADRQMDHDADCVAGLDRRGHNIW